MALAILTAAAVLAILLELASAVARRRLTRARAGLSERQVRASVAPYQPAGRALEVLPGGRREPGS